MHDLGRKSPAGEESRLLGALFQRRGQAAKFLFPNRARRVDFAVLQARLRCRERGAGDALFAQFVQNAGRPELTPAHAGQVLDEARLGQPAALLQIVEQGLQLAGFFGKRLQLRVQFLPGMIAPSQGFQRALAQAGWGRRQFGALLCLRLFGHMGADPGLDFPGHLGVCLEEFPGVVLALADPVLAVAVPRA